MNFAVNMKEHFRCLLYYNNCKMLLSSSEEQEASIKDAFKSLEAATEDVIKASFNLIPPQSQKYASQKVQFYTNIIRKYRIQFESMTSQFKRNLKEMTISIDETQPTIWSQFWNQYSEKEYTKQMSQFCMVRRSFIDIFRRIDMISSVRNSEDFLTNRLPKFQRYICNAAMKVILSTLKQFQPDQRIQIHVLLKVQLSLRMNNLLRLNFHHLVLQLQNMKYSQESNNIDILYNSLKRQFRELTSTFLKLACSKFYLITTNTVIDELNSKIKMLLSTQQKEEGFKQLKQLIKEFYTAYQENLISDVYNNLGKTFGQEMSSLDRMKYEMALNEIRMFDYSFGFRQNLSIFVKSYKSSWRGKLEDENKCMYNKHWNLINYLILTSPSEFIQYFGAFQEQRGKSMTFTMEKGSVAFTNFQQGYKYFRQLSVKQKIKVIIDLAESLITLQEHGINHYDITIRNTVKKGNRFKMIDFDVARMVDKEIDYSMYSSEDVPKIKQLRKEIIKQSRFLMERELKQQRLITRSNLNKQTTPIQNINRLAEYYSLPNIIDLLLLFQNKQTEFRSKFSKKQRLRLIFEYEKYIVGKRDCNKFALMILKLLYNPSEKFTQQQIITAKVEQFVKAFKRQRQYMNLQKYVEFFQLDPQMANTINQQLLRLITQLVIPEVEKRIPMKLFYLRLLKLLRIDKYPIVIKPRRPKQTLSLQLNQKSINIQSCLDQSSISRSNEIQAIENIFKRNVKFALKHHQECMEIYSFLSTSLADTINFPLGELNKQKEQIIQQAIKAFKKWIAKVLDLKSFAFGQIKYNSQTMLCFSHKGVPIEAYCQQVGCHRKWLCSVCLSKVFFPESSLKSPQEEQSYNHFKKIKLSALSSITQHHKILHYHPPNLSKEIICVLISKDNQGKRDKMIFQCRQCLQRNNKLEHYDEFYLINKQENEIYDRINIQGNHKQCPLISKTMAKRSLTSRQHMQINYSDIFNNIAKAKEMTQDEVYTLQQQLNDVKQYFIEWVQRMGEVHHQVQKNIYQNSQFKLIQSILNYLKIKSSLLLQLRKINDPKELTNFISELKLSEITSLPLKEKQLSRYLLDGCQYFIDAVNKILERLIVDCENQLQNCRNQRFFFSIVNRNIFHNYEITSSMRKTLGPNNNSIQKLSPSARTLHRRQKKAKKQMLTQVVMSHNNSAQSQISSQFFSKSLIKIQDDSSADQNWRFQICPCYQGIKYKTGGQLIIGICTSSQCNSRFVCKQCIKNHDQSHANFVYHFGRADEEEGQTEREAIYWKSFLDSQKSSLKVQKTLQKIVDEVNIQMINLINFIEQLTICIKDQKLFKKCVFQQLRKAAINDHLYLFSDIIWIVKHFANDPSYFLNVLNYGAERYLSQIDKITSNIKQSYNTLNNLPVQSMFTDPEKFQSTLQDKLPQKYNQIVNNCFKDVPMPFYQIFPRRCHYVQSIIIESIKQTSQLDNDTKKNSRIDEKKQFKYKLIRGHYNNFDIHLFWTYFTPQPNHLLSSLSKFKQLKILKITDSPHWDRPIVYQSVHIQSLLYEAEQLKWLQLACLNGFDQQCLRLLNKRHKSCLVSIDSFSDQVIERNWMNELFSTQPKVNLPFQIEGQILPPFQSQNIEQGEFELLFTRSTIHQNLLKLRNINKKYAHKLVLKINQLRQDTEADDGFPYYLVKINFWCRKTYGTAETADLEEKINQRYQSISSIFAPIQQKFSNVRYLTLHGLLMNDGYDPNASNLNLAITNYLTSLDKLQTLHLVKCFGLSLYVLFQNTSSLTRLIVEQSVFKLKDISGQPQFVKLQSLILKRVGVFDVAVANKKLESRQLSSMLSQFNLTTLELLVLNEFYELENKDLEWIVRCPLKRLSLRRCFRITNEIHQLLESLGTLEDLDITSTGINEQTLTQTIAVNSFYPTLNRLSIFNHLKKVKDMNLQSIPVLKEISRMAKTYHIRDIQHAVNQKKEQQKNQPQKLPLDLNDIKQITLWKSRITEMDRYYVFDIFSKLTQVQILTLDDCEWKNSRGKNNVQKFSDFKFIEGFKYLKQLTLVKAQLKSLQNTGISQYEYLRKLNLSCNHIQTIQKIQFTELRQLDLSHNQLQEWKIVPDNLKRLQKLNIQYTQLINIPTVLLLFQNLRIILSHLRFKQPYDTSYLEGKHPPKIIIQKLQLEAKYGIPDNYCREKILKYVEQLNLMLIEGEKGMEVNATLWQFGRSCFVFTSEYMKQLKKAGNLYYYLLDYELFKVEQDVKGHDNTSWFKRYRQHLQDQQAKQNQQQYDIYKSQQNHPFY